MEAARVEGFYKGVEEFTRKAAADPGVIRAQFGHVSPAMMGIYSHVHRKALNEAAEAVEPEATLSPAPNASVPSAEGVTSM